MDTLAWSEKLVENLELYCTYRVLPPNPRIDPTCVITKVPLPQQVWSQTSQSGLIGHPNWTYWWGISSI